MSTGMAFSLRMASWKARSVILPDLDQLAVQRPDLEPAEQVGGLVERAVRGREGAADLRRGVVALVADPLDQEVDALLGRHLLEVEAQREDDPGAAVHPPEEHADAVLGRLREAAVPEQSSQ